MQIIVRTDAIERVQMQKQVAKPVALKRMQEVTNQEHHKATDPWYRGRMDSAEAAKNARHYQKNLDRVSPETLKASTKDTMWRRAKILKDDFMVGMLSHDELHPVRGILRDGKMVWVVDEEKMYASRSIERNTAWYNKNNAKIAEFKNIMRHLCPENPNAGDIEKFRPKRKTV